MLGGSTAADRGPPAAAGWWEVQRLSPTSLPQQQQRAAARPRSSSSSHRSSCQGPSTLPLSSPPHHPTHPTPQVRKLPLGQKRAHLMEIQVNGGTVAAKVDYAYGMFEKVRGRSWWGAELESVQQQQRAGQPQCSALPSHQPNNLKPSPPLLPPGHHRRLNLLRQRDDRHHRDHQGPRYRGRRHALGRHPPAPQDPPRPPQGRVRRRVAPGPPAVERGARRPARLPPPYRGQQEDLQGARGGRSIGSGAESVSPNPPLSPNRPPS
jgi:hypothetical protein